MQTKVECAADPVSCIRLGNLRAKVGPIAYRSLILESRQNQ